MFTKLNSIRLRPWNLGDVDSLARHGNDRGVWINLRDQFPHPYRAEDGQAWIESLGSRNGRLIFAIDYQGEAIGGIGAHPRTDVYRLSAELGYWIGRPFWGQGIATSIVGLFVPRVFQEIPIRRLVAEVFSSNPASMRVLEKSGFERESVQRAAVYKAGQLLDSAVYVKLGNMDAPLPADDRPV